MSPPADMRRPPQGLMRRWLPSLQARVLLATLAGGLLTLTLAGGLLNGLFTRHVQRQFEAELGRQLTQLVARLEFGPQGQPQVNAAQLSDPRWVKPYGGLYWQINNAAHTPVLRSRSLWDQTLALPPDTVADGNIHSHTLAGPAGQTLLVLEQSVQPPDETDGADSPRWTLAVAADTQDMAQAVQALRGTLMLALAALLGLLGLAAAAQVWFGLAPLRAMRRSLADLNAGTTDRLGGNLPAEVQPLVDDFNRALQRLDDGLATARTQAGNLAHALKTPLAVLMHAADAAIRPAAAMPGNTAPGTDSGMPATPEQALQQLAAQVHEQVTRAQQHIDWHLRRARAAAHAGAHQRTSCELQPVLQGLMRVMDKLHAKRALDMALHTAPGLPASATVAVEAQDLHDMLGNLLDNACQWSRNEVSVHILADGPGHLCVAVDDDGPGIPAALRTQMLARGARLDETTPGSGLGLAIVTELAGLYGGALTLEESTQGGLSARLRLPTQSPRHRMPTTTDPSAIAGKAGKAG